MNKRTISKALALAVIFAPGLVTQASAQSADALIDKLVEKGILTVKEANDLRQEADQNFTQAHSVKTGMPDWVSALKISGDLRGRYESFFSDSKYDVPAGAAERDWVTRDRFRYRLRVGITATLFENFEVGLRLTSGEPAQGAADLGGDPISNNTTFKDNGSKKYIYLDTAYGKWNFLNRPDFTGSVTLGKMDIPLVVSDMVFDHDYTPEGIAFQTGYRFNDRHSLKFNAGAFILDEFARDTADPYMVAAQLRWDANWSKKVTTSAGVTGLAVQHPESLLTTAVPNQSAGNTRSSTGMLIYDYTPILGDASVTYTLPSFPMYKGAFPIKIGGEYMSNSGADYSADNYAWNAGIMFGKSGKKGTWDISYAYKWLGANAWYEELVDSDFGAFYAKTTTFPGSGAVAGYSSGTNVKGHIIRLTYSPTDFLSLSGKLFITELINPSPSGGDSQMNRLQVDATLKF